MLLTDLGVEGAEGTLNSDDDDDGNL